MNVMKDMAKTNPTPFYIYKKEEIASQIEILQKTFASAKILYSVKTNPFPEIVEFVSSKGVGADAASLREVELATESSIAKEDIYYSTPGKTKEDILRTIDKSTIIADSYNELEMINSIATENNVVLEVGLRVNPQFSMFDNKGGSSKFGVDEESILENKEYLSTLSNIKIVGIHVHVRSQVLSTDTLVKYYENVYDLGFRLNRSLGFDMKFINFGGGVGTVYTPSIEEPLDYEKLAKGFQKLADRNENELKALLLIESGRFIVCNAGFYVTEVVDIKESRGKKYLVVKNGLNGFMRPAIKELVNTLTDNEKFSAEPIYTTKYAFEFKILTDNKDMEIVDLVGNLCTSADVLASDILLPKAKIGDLVVVNNAGSYAYSLSPLLFSSHELPKQYLID